MEKDIIIFESADEVLIGKASNINKIVQEWFLEGKRNLDEYDITLADSSEVVQITSYNRVAATVEVQFDITELMPNKLRQELIDADLLTDES